MIKQELEVPEHIVLFAEDKPNGIVRQFREVIYHVDVLVNAEGLAAVV